VTVAATSLGLRLGAGLASAQGPLTASTFRLNATAEPIKDW